MQRRSSALGALLVGLLLGVAINAAVASRNSAGTFSLATGNPFVTGTTISSSTMNTTLSDIGTEITDSLNRSGKGGMLASLKLSNGTSSAPSIAWTSETNSGLYRAGSNDLRMQVAATQVQQWTLTGAVFPLVATTQAGITATNSAGNSTAITATGTGTGSGCTATGGATSGSGLTATGGAPNGPGVTATGTGSGRGVDATGGTTNAAGGRFTGGATNGVGVNGVGTGSGAGGFFTGGATGPGLTSTGGGTSGNGVVGIGTATGVGVVGTGGSTDATGVSGVGGTSNGIGVLGQGDGTGVGVSGIGGDSDTAGVKGTGGTTNGIGVIGLGTGTGLGGQFSCGTAASTTVGRVALEITNGYIHFNGVANPNSDVTITNRLTPKNIIKAFGRVTSSGGGACSLSSGFNIGSVAIQGTGACRVTLSGAMSGTDYTVTANSVDPVDGFAYVSARTSSTFDLSLYTVAGGATNVSTTAAEWDFIVVGPQT